MKLKITPLGELFAAELQGPIFHDSPTREQVGEIEAAMAQFAVLALRHQDITDSEQIAFSRAFGPLELPPNLGIRKLDTLGRIRPELYDVSNLDNRGEIEKPLHHASGGALRRPGREARHAPHDHQ